jgi:hypothetical protein
MPTYASRVETENIRFCIFAKFLRENDWCKNFRKNENFRENFSENAFCKPISLLGFKIYFDKDDILLRLPHKLYQQVQCLSTQTFL